MAAAPVARRHRATVLAALLVTIALGLLSRRFPLPGVFAEHTGDALYTVAAFFGLALGRPRGAAHLLAVVALAWSCCIEFTQLLQWPWLVELRSQRLVALVLGQGFRWQDLIAYGLGAVAAWSVDRVLFGARRARPTT